MFLITARFRPSRSKNNRNKAGVVFYQIIGEKTPDGRHRPCRCINSDIYGEDDRVLHLEKKRILSGLRLLYCVIEHLQERDTSVGIDDVAETFKKALNNDASMESIIGRSCLDFPLRSDIVSIGREFKASFQFIFSGKIESRPNSLSDFVFNLSQALKNDKRVNRARGYTSTLSNIRDFTQSKDIHFSEIDPQFVKRYAAWLSTAGISESTQSFYLRTLRSILNQAASKGLTENANDWFRDVNTSIDCSRKATIDKALDREKILLIERVDLGGDRNLELARDMFMFGFYCCGMELVDIAHLTAANIKKGFLIYRRRLKGQQQIVRLTEHARKILSNYQGDKYLFPLLDDSKGVLFQTLSNSVAHSMKSIGKLIGLPQLSFSMNIGSWKVLMSKSNISEMLLLHSNAALL